MHLMGILQGHLAAVLLCVAVAAGAASAQKASGVHAGYNVLYDISGNLDGAGAYCSTWDDRLPVPWLQKYPWAGFCGPVGPRAPAFCGKCLKVTNHATGASAKVRIVDGCHNGGLDLDLNTFIALDTNRVGSATGHLTVNYEFVLC